MIPGIATEKTQKSQTFVGVGASFYQPILPLSKQKKRANISLHSWPKNPSTYELNENS